VIDIGKENEVTQKQKDTQPVNASEKSSDLDPEILKIIGETPSTEPEGLKLSNHISDRWKNWLKTGQTKEAKELLLKKYPRKGECSLEAPKLNPEIAASLNEGSLKRDKYFSNTQNLAGSALSALSLVIDPILTKKREEIDVKKMLENLWESSRILTELFRGQTVARKACILPSLNKQTASLLDKTETGKFLFGEKLGEKIKESKVIDKISTDIKSQLPLKKPGTSNLNAKSPSYLRFTFQGKIYEFTCVPFGLCSAPFVFTKILKPVVNCLRENGFLSNVYLDDFLCMGLDIESCSKNLITTKEFLVSLGFIINEEKSNLKPSRRCKYLGLVIDSEKFCLGLTDKKRETILFLAQVIGTLTAACPAVEYGTLHCKLLEKAKTKALTANNDNYEKTMILPKYIHDDLRWWKKKIPVSFRKIRTADYQKEIFSDASLTGWGAFCDGQQARGWWKPEEKNLHINDLELRAAFLALKCFADDLRDCEILIRVDNSTAKAYINKMGGSQYLHLHLLAKEIWDWCEERNIWLYASYIPSRENKEADSLSRVKNIDTEWSLADYAFKRITKRFGVPSIDLFASRNNSKCKKYCAWERDPEAMTIDAFTINWKEHRFYAFPPFALIARVLQKIINDRACGVIVIPLWSTQPWFPLLKNLMITEMIIFKPNDIIREAFKRKNLPETSIEILSASLAESTIKQYNSALKDWWIFSKKKGRDPFCIEANSVLEFLSEKFRDGAAYGTLNTARSALSLISTQDITNNPIISRFFKGIFKLRPIKPKYDSTWDTEPVITKAADLYPLEKLTLQQLTKKLIILLALGTAHRVQTLSLISIDNIVQYKSNVQIKIPDIIKTSRPGASQPLLILPVFTDKPELCVANTLLNYIKRTKSLRSSEKRLFISIRKPHTAVSSQTLSRWIKNFLVDCGVDEKFTAHSTRHASTSKAAEAGVSLDLIRKTAGWSEKSLVFAKFYNRPISSQNNN
ncbi:GSCOCG00012047001-RA-CDS, partial [Cotesia congregata]